jgi:predicted metal-dependent enzyme (double-stranded beta helix superfamily)
VGLPPHDGLTVDGPVRGLFEAIAPYADPRAPDLARIADALVGLARDHDYLAPRISELGDTSGQLALHRPDRGPRLTLVHRRTGQMSAVHDHGVWVAIASIVGIETHRHYRRASTVDRERVEVVEDLALAPASCATLLPPDDIHAHGHVTGRGEAAYVLILLGDDQFAHRRSEWDPATGRRRTLEPGDHGRWLSTEPFTGTQPSTGAGGTS